MSNPEEDCLRTLESLRSRALWLARASPPPPSRDSVGTELGASVLGKVASDFVRSQGFDALISGRTAGSVARKWVKRSAKEQDRQAKAAWFETQLLEVDELIQDAETYLGTISIPSPSLTPEGNSHRLLRKLGRVHQPKKPDSKARALVSVLNEIRGLLPIPNDTIAVYLADKDVRTREEAFQRVTSLERDLRRLVKDGLSGVSTNWWIERVPPEVRKRAERYQRREKAIYPNVSDPENPLSYVGFSDYDDIILFDANWEECFQSVFKDRGWLSTKLRELEPIRNSIMHPRKLTQHGIEKLRVNSRDLLERMGRAK